MIRARADRRNTVDCAILNQMIIEPTIGDSKRSDKKSLHLSREAERDSKLALAASTATSSYRSTLAKRGSETYEERAESLPVTARKTQVIPKLIESYNRFMSVKSRPIGCRTSAPASAFRDTTLKEAPQLPNDSSINSRIDFHDTFSHLIKLGSVDKAKCLVSKNKNKLRD